MLTIRLGVNIDHVATLRQARGGAEPDPVTAAALAELGGADGITIHLREDRRHIQDRDLRIIRETVKTHLNLEMAATPEMMKIALGAQPNQATLVPERRQELTTEGGLDAVRNLATLKDATARLKDAGILVSLFIDPSAEQITASVETGAQAVEFHTGSYANATTTEERDRCLATLAEASVAGHKAGLHVLAGHGLNYVNIGGIVAIPEVEEVNIGHSIVSRAVFVGLPQAVREMKALLQRR